MKTNDGQGAVRTALRVMGTTSLIGFVIVGFTPTPNLLSRWMTVNRSPEPVEAIVVLGGGGVRGDGTLTDISQRRTTKGLELYRSGVAPLLVLSGARTHHGLNEANLRAGFAQACGVSPTAIAIEVGARTTHDEATRLAGRLLPRGIQKIALVVDAEGTRRAAAVFRQVGFTVVPVAASDVDGLGTQPEARLALMRRVLMETVAWLYYWLAGYV